MHASIADVKWNAP